jgi:peptide/nickel transport system permease protein
VASGIATEEKARSRLADFFRRLLKEKPMGVVGGVFTLLLLLTGIFANVLAPYGMNQIGAGPSLLGPSPHHLLGTDNLGRDLLTRVIYGARTSVIVGLASTTMATIIATLLGMLCGYLGGVFDLIVQRFIDGWLCFPGILILMVLISITGPGMVPVIVVLGISCGVASTRIIRGATMSTKENVYVEAAVAIGSRTSRVLLRHILPNIMAPIIILYSTLVPFTILSEAGLSFLGFGIPAPAASWGAMLSGSGRSYMFVNPWMAVWPGLALSITVYSVNMFGDAVRDILDPRLKGGVGRYGAGLKKTLKNMVVPTVPGRSGS